MKQAQITKLKVLVQPNSLPIIDRYILAVEQLKEDLEKQGLNPQSFKYEPLQENSQLFILAIKKPLSHLINEVA